MNKFFHILGDFIALICCLALPTVLLFLEPIAGGAV